MLELCLEYPLNLRYHLHNPLQVPHNHCQMYHQNHQLKQPERGHVVRDHHGDEKVSDLLVQTTSVSKD